MIILHKYGMIYLYKGVALHILWDKYFEIAQADFCLGILGHTVSDKAIPSCLANQWNAFSVCLAVLSQLVLHIIC